jgi:hypothetical protein
MGIITNRVILVWDYCGNDTDISHKERLSHCEGRLASYVSRRVETYCEFGFESAVF